MDTFIRVKFYFIRFAKSVDFYSLLLTRCFLTPFHFYKFFLISNTILDGLLFYYQVCSSHGDTNRNHNLFLSVKVVFTLINYIKMKYILQILSVISIKEYCELSKFKILLAKSNIKPVLEFSITLTNFILQLLNYEYFIWISSLPGM